MTENHFGPSAVNVITKTCSGEIRTVSQAQETKVHQTRSDFSVLVSQPSAGQGMKVLQLSVGAGPGGPHPGQSPGREAAPHRGAC